MAVFDKLHHIAFAKASKYPVVFLRVFQDSSSLEYTIFKITDIIITVFEPLLTHTCQLRILEVSSLYRFQIKGAKITRGLWVFKTKSEPQPINKCPLAETYGNFVA